jgi:DNA-binding protein HU-beta
MAKQKDPIGKDEIIEAVTKGGEVPTKAAAQRVVGKVLETILEALQEGRDVTLPGLGKFKVKQRAARQGRNPATGETMQVPAKKAVTFSVAGPLKKAVNA